MVSLYYVFCFWVAFTVVPHVFVICFFFFFNLLFPFCCMHASYFVYVCNSIKKSSKKNPWLPTPSLQTSWRVSVWLNQAQMGPALHVFEAPKSLSFHSKLIFWGGREWRGHRMGSNKFKTEVQVLRPTKELYPSAIYDWRRNLSKSYSSRSCDTDAFTAQRCEWANG